MIKAFREAAIDLVVFNLSMDANCHVGLPLIFYTLAGRIAS
jgi:hypothetical protein